MFQIRYRIFGNTQELKMITAQEFDADPGICGEIEISFGEHKIGYCPDGALWDNAYGSEWLNYWVESILDVLICFKNGIVYAAFSAIEYHGVWLEFRMINSDVIINVTNKGPETVQSFFITEENVSFRYVEPMNTKIPYDQFKKVILDLAKHFYTEVECLNSALRDTVCMHKIADCIQQLM